MKLKSPLTTLSSVVFICIVSVALGYLNHNSSQHNARQNVLAIHDVTGALFNQKVVETRTTPVEITKIYNGSQLLGVISDSTRLDALFQTVYETEYQAEFPDSKLGFVQDVYQTTEYSYNIYENVDDTIFQYIYDADLIAIEVDKISFSNGAVIYVKNREDFVNARKDFYSGVYLRECVRYPD